MIEITDLMEENIFTSEENFQVDEREENGMTEPVSTFFVDQAFASIPQWHRVTIIACIYVIGCFVNALILRIYWRLESSNRLYVLAMALQDLFCLHFVLLPPIFRMFAPSDHIRDVISVVRATSGFVYFNTYLIAPLLLAIDRFVAVMFPHKVLIILPKLRPIKIVVVPALSLLSIAYAVADLTTEPDSIWSVAMQLSAIFSLSIQAVGIFGLYLTIALKLMLASRKITQNKRNG